jgi:4-hydroxythreonine-4-phosphate dehydrogenase
VNPALALTCGDPAGIGPEIAAKCLCDLDINSSCRLVMVGDADQLHRIARTLELQMPQSVQAWDGKSALEGAGPFLLDMGPSGAGVKPGTLSAESGKAAMAAIRKAAALAYEKKIQAIVTAPISKKAMEMAGFEGTGHTEILAKLTDSRQVGMMFVTPSFKVILLSTHLSLRQAIACVTKDRLAGLIRFVHAEHKRIFGAEPRIGVAGLNPHAGEDSLFGEEEEKEIAPAIEACRDTGIEVWGPYPPDSIYLRAERKEIDVVVALYHDQAMIPVKIASFGRSAGLTLGLPFLRTSVDHGTALDIAGRGVADPSSLREAIALAARLARNST